MVRLAIILLCLSVAGCLKPSPSEPVRTEPVTICIVGEATPQLIEAAQRAEHVAQALGVRLQFATVSDLPPISDASIAVMFPGEFPILLVKRLMNGDHEQPARGGTRYAIVSASADVATWEQVFNRARTSDKE